jgi:seryl-tRNA synthetase
MARMKMNEVVTTLPASYEEVYEKRCEMDAEMSRLKRLVEELKKDRDELDTKLAKAFVKASRRRLSDGTILERNIVVVEEQIITEEMVGDVKRAGYSFVKYKEIAER